MPQNAIWVLCLWKVGEESAKNTPTCEKEAARQAENKIHPAAVPKTENKAASRKQGGPRKQKQPLTIVRGCLSGAEGTRTLDLRRDRPAF